MEVFESVRTVLAVRSYRDEPVPPEVVRRVVDAAHLSASSQNRQPWHFIVVEGRGALRELGALLRSGPYTADAAFAVVVGINSDASSGPGDAARAIQSMVLTAWGDGVGSNWVGVPNADVVKALLGVPDGVDLFAVVPFGYPATPVGRGRKNRKPLGEVAYRGRFGVPFT